MDRSILGFPRMGRLRDLKKATEAYWSDKISRDELLAEGKRLRLEHWKIQKDAGVDVIPSNDFAFYDQVLDHHQLFGTCLLYTSDAADDMQCVDLGCRRIIKKKKKKNEFFFFKQKTAYFFFSSRRRHTR